MEDKTITEHIDQESNQNVISDPAQNLLAQHREKRENAIREAKINLILEAAQRIFALRGFHEARLEDIAAEAGFSKASLYNYYQDKESIFLSLAVRDYTKIIITYKEIIGTDLAFKDKMRRILETLFKMFGEHFAIYLELSNFLVHSGLSVSKLQTHHEALMENFRKLHLEISLMITSVIKTAREKGEIHSPLSDAVIASYFGALIRGVIFKWRIDAKIGDWQQETDNLIEFMLHGVE